jgi:hypothetical protein
MFRWTQLDLYIFSANIADPEQSMATPQNIITVLDPGVYIASPSQLQINNNY